MKYLYGAVISLIFFIVLLLTFSQYGMNEDSPGHFMRGQTYLHKLTTGIDLYDQPTLPPPVMFYPSQRISTYKYNVYEDGLSPQQTINSNEGGPTIQAVFRKYADLYGRHSIYEHNAWGMNYFMTNDGGHPPISDIIEATTNRIFYETLGIVSDLQGYYLYIAIVASLFVFFFYCFIEAVWGRLLAIVASLSLCLYPFFFAESHFNIKDIPELCYFGGSLMAFYFWVLTRKKRWFIAYTIIFFLGVGTKLNILFVPVILLLWLAFIHRKKIFKKWFTIHIPLYLVVFIIFNAVLFIALWPYLWNNPMQNIVDILKFYAQTGSTDLTLQVPSKFLLPFNIDLSGLLYVLTMTPTPMVLFFIWGLFLIVKNIFKKNIPESEQKHHAAEILILIWLLMPIARVLRPGGSVFESIRQYSEFLPALIIISTGGALNIFGRIGLLFKKSGYFVIGLFLFFYIAYLISINVYFHPNGNNYFNILIGGPKGAVKVGLLDWQTVYDVQYKQLIDWMNANSPPNSKIAFLDGTMVGIMPLWLRDDLRIGSYFSGFDRKGEYIVSAVYPQPPQVFPYLYLEKFLQPVYELKVDGAVIGVIWKNDAAHTKPQFQNQTPLSSVPPLQPGKDAYGAYWQLNFDKSYQVTSLTADIPSKGCDMHEGIFDLNTFFVPFRRAKNDQVVFYFPAILTSKIRYYTIFQESCMAKAKITDVEVVK